MFKCTTKKLWEMTDSKRETLNELQFNVYIEHQPI